MKIKLLFVVALCLAAFLFCAKEDVASEVAILVNGREITSQEIDLAAEMLRQDMAKHFPSSLFDEFGQLRKNAAQQTIANILMIEEATKNNVAVDSAMVGKIMAQMSSQFSTKQDFQQKLGEMGETIESLYSQIEKSLMVELHMKEVLSKTDSVSQEQVRAFYEENREEYREKPSFRLSQIVIEGYKDDDTITQKEAMQRAELVLEKVKKGVQFEELAQKFSSVPEKSDMGLFRLGELRGDLEEKVLPLEVGGVTDAIVAGQAIYLFKKTAQISGGIVPFEEVQERIKSNLELKKQSKVFNEHISELMEAAQIHYLDTTLVIAAQ